MYISSNDKERIKADESITQSFRNTFLVVSKNRLLVTYGCPLYRLMVELSATDKEFDAVLSTKVNEMKGGIKMMLEQGIALGEFDKSLNSESFATYMLTSVWGILSLSPSLSSSKTFLIQSQYILDSLDAYKLT